MTEEKRTVHLEVCLQILNINYEVVDGVVKVYYNTVTDELKKILFPPFNLLTHNLVYEAVERVEEVLKYESYITYHTTVKSKCIQVWWYFTGRGCTNPDDPIQVGAPTRIEAECKALEKIISIPELAKLLEEK